MHVTDTAAQRPPQHLNPQRSLSLFFGGFNKGLRADKIKHSDKRLTCPIATSDNKERAHDEDVR